AIAANALFRLGYAQERIGQAQARKSYEQLVRQYADQTNVAEEARTRLAALTEAENAPRNPAITIAEIDPRTGMIHGPVVRLTQGNAGSDQFPTWTSDGKSVAFKRTVGQEGKQSTTVIMRSLDARNEKSVAQTAAGPAAWLQDGTIASKNGNV